MKSVQRLVIYTFLSVSLIALSGCVKKNKVVTIPTNGAPINNSAAVTSQQTNVLTDYERKYLVWLLRWRKEAGFESKSIKHYYTKEEEGCPECSKLYYTWGDPPVFAYIIVTAGEIESAVDSTGYDYIARKQGEPINFPELDKVKFEGERCGGKEQFVCGSGLTCQFSGQNSMKSDQRGRCVKKVTA